MTVSKQHFVNCFGIFIEGNQFFVGSFFISYQNVVIEIINCTRVNP